MRLTVIFCILICVAGVNLVGKLSPQFEAGATVDRTPNVKPKPGYNVDKTFHVARHRDGHFYVTAQVEGRSVLFLVDTGASHIMLSNADAQRLGYVPGRQAYRHAFNTANGVSHAAKVRLNRVKVGGKTFEKVDAFVSQEGLGISLLGQSLLSRYKSMEITPTAMKLHG